jgi:cytochrome b
MKIRVWDLPTRLFHWALATCVTGAILYGNLGGQWMVWHFRCGYAVLALLLFRLVWALVGPRYARWRDLTPGLTAVSHYLNTGKATHPGHNPLAGLALGGLLVVLLVQALGGVFASDGLAASGPLHHWLAAPTGELISSLHKANRWLIYALVGLHLAAVAWYSAVRHEPLVEAMLTGDKEVHESGPTVDDTPALWLRALVILSLCSLLVWLVVKQA